MDPGTPGPVKPRTPDGAAFQGAARASRRAPLAVAVATGLFLAIALIAGQLGPTDDRASPPPLAATSVPSATSAATPSVAPSVLEIPARDPSVTPIPDRALSPAGGPITLAPAGSSSIEVSATVPDGWSRAGPSMVVLARDGGRPSVSLSAWIVADVFALPCRWSSGPVVDPALLSTAVGQAEALAAWWGQDPRAPLLTNAPIAPLATRPTPGSIAGRHAWLVGVLVPRAFDFDLCDGNQLVLWRAANGAVRATTAQGELHRLHVLDLDGTILVIDATSSTSASVDDQTALLRVISSMRIGP